MYMYMYCMYIAQVGRNSVPYVISRNVVQVLFPLFSSADCLSHQRRSTDSKQDVVWPICIQAPDSIDHSAAANARPRWLVTACCSCCYRCRSITLFRHNVVVDAVASI